MTEPGALRFQGAYRALMAEQVWVVAACFNEAEVISTFMERVLALPEVDHLLLIDDGSSDATVSVIRAWQQNHADYAVAAGAHRNFGKEAAMLAGLDYANGRCAVLSIPTFSTLPSQFRHGAGLA